MNTRYFKDTTDGSMWRFPADRPGEFLGTRTGEWVESVCGIEDMDYPTITETDADGNPLPANHA